MFTFITDYLKRRRERESEEVKNQRAADLKIRKELLADIATIEKNLISRKCPLNNNDNCFKECVHFFSGRIVSGFFDGQPSDYLSPPACRLWGEK